MKINVDDINLEPPNRKKQIAVMAFVILALTVMLLPILSPLFSKFGVDPHEPVFIGIVNVQEIFDQSARGKMQSAAYQEQYAQKSREVEALRLKAAELEQQVQGYLNKGNQAAAAQKIPTMRIAQQEFLTKKQQVEQELQKAQSNVDQTFMSQLRTVVEQIRKDEKLDIVLAHDPSKILSYDTTLNLTQKALELYNRQFPANTATKASVGP